VCPGAWPLQPRSGWPWQRWGAAPPLMAGSGGRFLGLRPSGGEVHC
jgi:hypothetical protein